MGIIETVSRAFNLTNANRPLVGLVFVINGVVNLIGFAAVGEESVDLKDPGKAAILLPVALFSIVVGVVVQGGLLGSVRDLIQKKVSGISQFVGYAKRFFVRLFGLGALFFVIVGGLWMSSVLIASLLDAIGGGQTLFRALGSLTTLAGGLASMVAVLLLLFSSYALVERDRGILPSMKESITFVKACRFKVVSLVALISAIWFMVVVISRTLMDMLGAAIGGNIAFGLLDVAITSIILSYLNVFNAGVYMSYYMAGQAGPADQDTPRPA